MTSSDDTLSAVLAAFSAERDWARFHTPKNLAMALAGETGELLSELQWLTPEESDLLTPERLTRVQDELADVRIYLQLLADRLGIDLNAAALAKVDRNRGRFPPSNQQVPERN